MTYNINAHILRYIEQIETGEIVACKYQQLLVAYVRKCFATEEIYTDDEQLEKYISLAKYFSFESLFTWEAFCIALHLCTFWSDTKNPRWPDLLLLIGRGAGKDGYIALTGMCLISPYSKLQQYDVDICANAEEQAMRPVKDIYEVMEDRKYTTKMKKHFTWTKEMVVGRKYRGIVRGRTNNPKSKDGMRSGIVVFNEIHQYTSYANIKVFVTGLGKKKHPRRLYATTDGDVREGPLDEYKADAEKILKCEIGDNGLLPFICTLDDKADADDEAMWPKANPSLVYLPHLMMEMKKEYTDWKRNPIANADFMTKRMNLPQTMNEIAVTSWENIIVTKREMPDLIGKKCVVGIDYASVSDFASCILHFKIGDMRYDIGQSWMCLQSKDLHRITAPWREWAELGYLNLVEDVEIHPDLLCEWIFKQARHYQINKLAMDHFRYALFSNSLKNIGFDAADQKNVKLVRPSDIMRVHPVIESAFNNQSFVWGDAPVLRWATYNTKLVRQGKVAGTDTGNFFYAKIEAKSRKTDPFMALAAAMTIEEELDTGAGTYDDIPVIFG